MFEMHRWDLKPAEAKALQLEIAGRVKLQPLPAAFKVLGAADLGYVPASNRLVAVMVTFKWPDLEFLESTHVAAPVTFPYVPGLLSFREVPSLLEVHGRLRHPPDVLLCDGQGIAHPRRIGLASHLGLCLGIPTVGCAKKLLCGKHDELATERGSATPLRLRDETVGWVFRSRSGVKPIYISPGHLSDLDSSLDLVRMCLGRFRIPEPLRKAHHLATLLRREIASVHSETPEFWNHP